MVKHRAAIEVLHQVLHQEVRPAEAAVQIRLLKAEAVVLQEEGVALRPAHLREAEAEVPLCREEAALRMPVEDAVRLRVLVLRQEEEEAVLLSPEEAEVLRQEGAVRLRVPHREVVAAAHPVQEEGEIRAAQTHLEEVLQRCRKPSVRELLVWEAVHRPEPEEVLEAIAATVNN